MPIILPLATLLLFTACLNFKNVIARKIKQLAMRANHRLRQWKPSTPGKGKYIHAHLRLTGAETVLREMSADEAVADGFGEDAVISGFVPNATCDYGGMDAQIFREGHHVPG